jgi:hypothetical protein
MYSNADSKPMKTVNYYPTEESRIPLHDHVHFISAVDSKFPGNLNSISQRGGGRC